MLLMTAKMRFTPQITACLILLCVALIQGQRVADEAPPAPAAHIVLMIGEREYHTEHSLRNFATQNLQPRGIKTTFITAPDDGPDRHHFTGLAEALQHADLLVVSVRRRGPNQKDLDAIRSHLNRGGGLIGLRTASHAFAPREKLPDGHGTWPEFDAKVLGGNYHGHYGAGQYQISVAPGAADHPILRGVTLTFSDKLYRTSPLNPDATALLMGEIKDRPAEPIAWTHTYGPNDARVFYTSMGVTSDFKNEHFSRMLVNAMVWATHNRVAPATSGD
jgi:type 1 glutamine amidotransferase